MKANPNFMAALEQQVEKEALVLFICRSGHRSHFAANVATQAGYSDCYNVLVGCEGDLSADKRRNAANSWRGLGLPWQQN